MRGNHRVHPFRADKRAEYPLSALFFDSYGSVYRDTLVETSLRNTAYSDWYTGVTENASYTEQSFGMRFTHK